MNSSGARRDTSGIEQTSCARSAQYRSLEQRIQASHPEASRYIRTAEIGALRMNCGFGRRRSAVPPLGGSD
jgi:hypothetical protein